MKVETKEQATQFIAEVANKIALFPFVAMLSFAVKRVPEIEKGYYAKTDGFSIFYGSKFFELDFKSQVAIELHELLHIMLFHFDRQGQREMSKWNVATDYAINLIVREVQKTSSNLVLPDFALYNEKYRGLTAEEIFDLLPREEENSLEDLERGYGDSEGSPGDSGLSPGEIENLKSAIAKCADDFSKGINCGNLPFGEFREIKEFSRPKFDWRRMLSRYIQEIIFDYSFTVSDRRFWDEDFFIPSLTGKKISISVAIDASGSITQDDLAFFAAELFGVLGIAEEVEINILTFDTVAYNQEVIKSSQGLVKYLKKVRGGGGTDFRPAFLEVEKAGGDVILFFTDGYGPFPTFAPRKPVIWLCNCDNKDFPDWGIVCYLKDSR